MAKLKEGEKVEQKFSVSIKFKAQEGDVKIKPADVKDAILNATGISPQDIKVVVKAA